MWWRWGGGGEGALTQIGPAVVLLLQVMLREFSGWPSGPGKAPGAIIWC